MRAIAALAVALLLAAPAAAAPSFDCGKARSDAENTVCKWPDLQWFDRQLARLYKLAHDPLTPDGSALLAGQRDFLARRERCGASIGCIWLAYEKRLTEVARWVDLYDPYAKYERPRAEGEGGGFWIARFGRDAAVSLWAAAQGKTCALETDSAVVTGRGVVRWAQGACRITIVPDGDDLRVETKHCEARCAAPATFDGAYSRSDQVLIRD